MRSPRILPRAAFFALLVIAGDVLAKPIRFEIRDPFNRNRLRAEAEGTVESTTAVLTYIHGFVELDPADLQLGIKGEIDVDLRRLETGIPSKNDFLREKILAVPEFPHAKISLDKLVSPSAKNAADGVEVTARVTVKIAWHGALRELMVPIRLTYLKNSELTRQRLPGNLLRISAETDLDLAAFNVAIPEAVRGRFSRSVRLAMDVTGTDQSTFDLPIGSY